MIKGQWLAVLIALVLVALPIGTSAHEGDPHAEARKDPAPNQDESVLAVISATYQESVKPIFDASCADCHGAAADKPWYYRIPGVSHLIDRDIREAREHLDLRNGFPFGGHGTPPEDLKAIAGALRDESMPPLRYRWMHSDAGLTTEEVAMVLAWVEQSLGLLEAEQASVTMQQDMPQAMQHTEPHMR